MAKVGVLFLLMTGLWLPGYAQKKIIAVIGSSTAAGYHLPDYVNGNIMTNNRNAENDNDPPNSWVNRLRRYYMGLNLLGELYNFSITGQDINQAMPDGAVNPPGQKGPDPRNNVTRALSVHPDIILINFPTNGFHRLPDNDVMARIHTIYDAATANGHTICYICTTQPRASLEWPDIQSRQRLKALRDRIIADFPDNSIDFYTPFVDDRAELSPGVANANYLGIKPEYDQGDAIHLNETGHLLLFNAVLAKNIIPVPNLPLKVSGLHVKRIDDTHISVTFTILGGNLEKKFFIWVKNKAGDTKSVRVVIPDWTKLPQTVSETIQIY
jgi:hypothetical protein